MQSDFFKQKLQTYARSFCNLLVEKIYHLSDENVKEQKITKSDKI